MKIILLVSKLSGGGAERVASELSLNLPDNIERVLVLLENKKDYPYKGDLKVLNTKKVGRYNFPGRIFNILSRYWQFRKIVKTENPDWVIAFSPALCFLSSLVFKNTVARANTYHSLANKSFLEKIKIKIAYQRAEKVTAISYGVKEDLQKSFYIKKEIKVIHNPTDINVIKNNIAEENSDPLFKIWIQEKIPIIITAGRLVEQKGCWHLIRAFSKLREDKVCRLVILGEGPMEDKLKNLAKSLGVKEDIYFVGFQKNPYIYFSKANIFILSSLCEGFGKVIVEAMACSLPIISTDCRSGPREILAPDTDFRKEAKEIEFAKYGILTAVPDGNFYDVKDELTKEENEISKAMFQMLENEEFRQGYLKKSLQRAKDFGIKEWIEKWLEVLKYKI